MLQIVIHGGETYDQETQTFASTSDVVLQLEHSLASLSKWEMKYNKPFLHPDPKTDEEVLEYIKIMNQAPNVPDSAFALLTQEDYEAVSKYLSDTFTATWFTDTGSRRSSQTFTNELIYYWLFSLGIPIECEHWHLNRLFVLMRVFSAQNEKKTKTNPREQRREQTDLNAQRRAQLGTSG